MVDIYSGDPYRRIVMITPASRTAASTVLDAHVETTGGLSAFALFYLGYAYAYFSSSPTGGP